MSSSFFNLVQFYTPTIGQTTLIVGMPLEAKRTPSDAFIADGTTVSYSIVDGSNYEYGRGVIGSSGTTLTRSVIESSTGSAIALSGNAIVAFVLLAEDIDAFATIDSPAFTGVPTAATAAPGTSTGQLATTAFVEAAMDISPVTPSVGNATAVVMGGTAVVAVTAVPAGLNGGYIVNPQTATDQGIATAETLYVDIVGTAVLGAYGTTVALSPGQTFTLPAGQTTAVSVNAVTSGHQFTAVWW